MRHDIEFDTEDGTTLRGWHYLPDEVEGPVPTVVMAHGFSATKEIYLDDFAEVFSAAGLGVVVFDHRGLGDSDGEPRQHIDPWAQVNSYRDAITWAQSQATVDADRIGVWGSSYAGGHVLVVAALDRRVRCVVSQVPLTYGLATAQRLIRGDHWKGLRENFDADRAARLAGEPPALLPVTAPEGEPCALPTADTYEFFTELEVSRGKNWRNEVTLHAVELFTEYEPAVYISRISPTPLLVVAAREDHLVPFDLTAKAYEEALEPKELLVLPGGHFDAYTGEPFAISSAAQRDWFLRHL
ncbi:alpha/beta hydrolase [Nitriliruptor alkaliphilus]|uniref:alpha/beta hydrolase n=1 Tax=Nitriliruptor alkaliphilus TaxID=427918 RepID=UPI000696FF18|nr:alpha/beta hydrolase [Nitriliruptor alkaliphilus]